MQDPTRTPKPDWNDDPAKSRGDVKNPTRRDYLVDAQMIEFEELGLLR